MRGDEPWWVVVNPAAGSGREVERRTASALARWDLEGEVVPADRPGGIEAAVCAGMGRGFRRFAAVGGDGTAHAVVNALLGGSWEEPPVLGILPAGTGCDLLRVFALPQRLEEAAAHLRGDQVYRADVGWLEGPWGRRYFLNVGQAGVGAATARRASRLPRRMGRRKYQLALWTVLPGFRPAHVELEGGRRSYRGPALSVVFANGQYFGGGINVAPRANLVDGELDLQVFRGGRRQVPALLPRLKRGLHLAHPAVRRWSAPEFRLETDRPWAVEADGEYLGSTPIQGGVVRGAVALKI